MPDSPFSSTAPVFQFYHFAAHPNVSSTQAELGVLEPIRCLDALLFAYQNSRVSQLEQPTEFVASVLRREVDGQPRLAIVFGVSDVTFPPKTAYGFDVVEEHLAEELVHFRSR